MGDIIKIGQILSTINDVDSINIDSNDEFNVDKKEDGSLDITNKMLGDHINNFNNPHNVTKDQIGLDKVSNMTADEILYMTKNYHINNAIGIDIGALLIGKAVYSMEMDLNESDPTKVIKYIGLNQNYKPAHMDYNNNVFDYGDWGDAWFIKNLKVVLMRFDGTIECELNPNDYTKDINGNPVDISSSNTIGNVMVGIPTVWIKYDTTDPMKPRFTFSPIKVDDDYHAYAHTDKNGIVRHYKYIGTYISIIDDSERLRSLSNVEYPMTGNYTDKVISQLRYYSNHNYNGSYSSKDNPWEMFAYCDWMLINLLLLLIGKSTNTQEVFGHGNEYGLFNNGSTKQDITNWPSNGYGVLNSGVMNTKGLFYGTKDLDHHEYRGVKVFGIENYWGNVWKMLLGYTLTTGKKSGVNQNKIWVSPSAITKYAPYLTTSNIVNQSLDYNIYSRMTNPSYTEYHTLYEYSKYSGGSGYQSICTEYGLIPIDKTDDSTNDQYFPDLFGHNYSESTTITTYIATVGGENTMGQSDGAFNVAFMSTMSTNWAFNTFITAF